MKKQLLVLGLVAGLVAGSLIAPAAAKKKKKKPAPAPVPVSVDQKFFLRQDSDACGESHEHLSLTDGPDLSCFYLAGGAVGEVNETADGPFISTIAWTTEDGVPFVFDTAKHLTGELVIRGGDIDAGTGPVSAGMARFDIVVSAEVGGEFKELGAVTEEWATVPGDAHLIKLDLEIDPALAGQQVTTFAISTTLRGASVGPHSIELEAPAAFVTIPTLVTQ